MNQWMTYFNLQLYILKFSGDLNTISMQLICLQTSPLFSRMTENWTESEIGSLRVLWQMASISAALPRLACPFAHLSGIAMPCVKGHKTAMFQKIAACVICENDS